MEYWKVRYTPLASKIHPWNRQICPLQQFILSKSHLWWSECKVLSTPRLFQDGVRESSVELGLKSNHSTNYFQHIVTAYQFGIRTRHDMWFPQLYSLPMHRLRNESLHIYLRSVWFTVIPAARFVASSESVSLFVVTPLKHAENNRENDGSGSSNTQPNNKRTATGLLRRSESKYSSGQIKWNTSWPRVMSTSALLYFFGGICSKWGYIVFNDFTSFTSVPTWRWSLTYGLIAIEEQEPPEWTGVSLSFTIWVFTTWWQLMPCTVIFVGVPFAFSLSANLDEVQAWLQAESQSAKTLSDLSLECNSTSVIWRSPSTSATEGKLDLSLANLVVHLCQSNTGWSFRIFYSTFRLFAKKFRSAPWRNVLWKHSQHSLVHLRGCGNVWMND